MPFLSVEEQKWKKSAMLKLLFNSESQVIVSIVDFRGMCIKEKNWPQEFWPWALPLGRMGALFLQNHISIIKFTATNFFTRASNITQKDTHTHNAFISKGHQNSIKTTQKYIQAHHRLQSAKQLKNVHIDLINFHVGEDEIFNIRSKLIQSIQH